jgi:rubrerythrin
MTDRGTGITGILTNAIEMELEGKSFFDEVSKQARVKRTRDTFMSLVKQEQKHVDILVEELGRLQKGMGFASLSSLKGHGEGYPKISVFQDKEFRRLRFDPDASELEALKLGIEVEKKSIEYYRSAGAGTADKSAKEVFNWLVGEEAGHLTILSSEYDYRTKSGFYYDNMEFSLEVE